MFSFFSSDTFVPLVKRVVLDYYVTAALMVVLLVLLWRIRKYLKLYAEFPTFPLMRYIVYSIVTNRIPKHLPFTAFFFQNCVRLAQRFQKEGLVLVWGPEPHLALFGKDAVKAFINEKHFIEKGNKYGVLADTFGTGLLTSDVDTWRKHRKLLNPVFHMGMLKKKIPIFNKNADILVKELEKEVMNETSIEILELLQTCSFSVLCDYVYGLDTTISEDKKVIKSYMKEVEAGTELMLEIMGKPWMHFKFLWKFFPVGRKYAKFIDVQKNLTKKIISELREKIISRKADSAIEDDDWNDVEDTRKSFAHVLLDNHLKDNSFTIEDIQSQITTFTLAGFDTISHGLLWTLFLLGHHPDIQDKVYNEVNTLTETNINYEDLHKLKYLECVIKESFRLYPPVLMYLRKINEDVQYGKYNVPKGTEIAIFIYMLHRDPDVFPDPEEFDPDRFQKNNPPIRPENYIPFGSGTRNCIGKGFAMIEMKVIIAYIIRKFRITSLERRKDVDLNWNLVLSPVRPLRFRFRPRQ